MFIDDALAIAHNKVIVIDEARVITGSFNFTRNADTRNAENVMIFDSSEIAARFTANWETLRAVARRFEAE